MSSGSGTHEHIPINSTSTAVAANEWLQTEGFELREEVRDGTVCYTLWIPIPRGGDSPWKVKGSRCLNDFQGDSKHWPLVKMLQLAFVLTELAPRQGTPSWKFDTRTNPRLFERCLDAFCRCYMGCRGGKREHYQLVEKYIKYTSYFDPAMYTALKQKQQELNTQRQTDSPAAAAAAADDDDGDDLLAALGEDGINSDGDEDDFEEVYIPLPPMDPGELNIWRANVEDQLQNGSIQRTDLPTHVQQAMNVPLAAAAAADENDPQPLAQQAVAREHIAHWVRDFLPDVVDDWLVRPDTTTVIDETPLMWPLSYCPRPPIVELNERDDNEFLQHRDAPASCGMQPKVDVTWFVVGENGPHSVMRFCVFDPLLDVHFIHDTLNQQNWSNEQSNRKRPQWVVEKDPLRYLRCLGYAHIANDYSEQRYEQMLAYFLSSSNGSGQFRSFFNGSRTYLTDVRHPCHITNVLTFENAMNILRMCGAHVDALAAVDHRGHVLYPAGVKSYTLHPTQAFWHHPRYLGIGFTQWPFEDNGDNFALQLVTGEVSIRNNQLQLPERNATSASNDAQSVSSLNDLAASYSRRYVNPIVDKQQLARIMPRLLNYETGDQIMIWQAEAEAAFKIIDSLYPTNPAAERLKYAEYCKAMTRMRESALDKFCSIWVTDGMVQNKPIAGSIKCVLTYLSDTLGKMPADKRTITCHAPLNDPDMSVWGNMMVQKMMIYRQANTIINCMIPMFAGWLQSAWDKKRKKPGGHVGCLGDKEVGKTFPFHTFIEKNFVNGTFVSINSHSSKAFFIDGHIGARIVLCDEPEKYVFSAKEEDRHYQEVQDLKAVLSSEERNRTVLKIIPKDDGDSERKQHIMQVDDGSKWAYCCNQSRDKSHALGSRIFQLVIPKSKISPGDMEFQPGAALQIDAAEFTRIEQTLVIQVYTAIRVGVLRDVDMWLYHQVSTRVFSILRAWQNMDVRKGDRSRQLIESFVRYHTILRAIAICYHMPGGPLYKKVYDPADVVQLGPFLVPTLEIIYAALHMMISELIDEDAANVLKACCKVSQYDAQLSAYQNYKLQEKPGTIPFRKQKWVPEDNVIGQQHQQQQQHFEKDRFNLNLNYISLSGTLETIAAKVAPYTEPMLGERQIIQVLEYLIAKSFKTERDECYRLEREVLLEKWVYRDEAAYNDVGEQVVITEQSLLVPCEWLQAAEYWKDKKLLFICPGLINMLDVAVVERAFNLAVMTSRHPRMKAIKGLVYPDHPDLFRVSVWDDAFVQQFVQAIDEQSPNAEIKRADGIALRCGEKLTEMEQNWMLSSQFNPNRLDHDDTYASLVDSRSRTHTVIVDWELEAATRVARQHGERILNADNNEYSNDVVIWTETKIREQYFNYCAAHPDAAPVFTNRMRYPTSIIQERTRDAIQQKQITSQMVNGRSINISSEPDVTLAHQNDNAITGCTVLPQRQRQVRQPNAPPQTQVVDANRRRQRRNRYSNL